jgi:hypothetical protein
MTDSHRCRYCRRLLQSQAERDAHELLCDAWRADLTDSPEGREEHLERVFEEGRREEQLNGRQS